MDDNASAASMGSPPDWGFHVRLSTNNTREPSPERRTPKVSPTAAAALRNPFSDGLLLASVKPLNFSSEAEMIRLASRAASTNKIVNLQSQDNPKYLQCQSEADLLQTMDECLGKDTSLPKRDSANSLMFDFDEDVATSDTKSKPKITSYSVAYK